VARRQRRDLLLRAADALAEVEQPMAVAIPRFTPALDFVPIPGRMRLRVSNDQGFGMGAAQGFGEHRLRAAKWGVEDLYIQRDKDSTMRLSSTGDKAAHMSVSVRPQNVHELRHRWATPIMTIEVQVFRKWQSVLNYVYTPMLLMTLVSLTTILVGYGMDLVSAFGDRSSITLTLLLTVSQESTP
jgi:hypothetical protein